MNPLSANDGYPVSTRRRFDVVKTLFGCQRRCYNVETTSRVHPCECNTLLIPLITEVQKIEKISAAKWFSKSAKKIKF